MTALLAALMMSLGSAGALVLAFVVFAETGLLVGFFLPGDSLLFTGGLLVAAGAVPLPVTVVIGATWLAAAAGDQIAYRIGQRLGRRSLSERVRWLPVRHAESAVAFFDHHGHKAVILARFVPLARTLTPVVAGALAMPRRRFTFYNLIGGLLWTAGLISAGYFLGGVSAISHHVELIAVAVDACVAVVAAPAVWRMIRSRRQTRQTNRQASRHAGAGRAPGRCKIAA